MNSCSDCNTGGVVDVDVFVPVVRWGKEHISGTVSALLCAFLF